MTGSPLQPAAGPGDTACPDLAWAYTSPSRWLLPVADLIASTAREWTWDETVRQHGPRISFPAAGSGPVVHAHRCDFRRHRRRGRAASRGRALALGRGG